MVTPSEALISALESAGHDVDIGKPKKYTVDLSSIHPMDLDTHHRHRFHATKNKPRPLARMADATILANYILDVLPVLSTHGNINTTCESKIRTLDNALLRVFDDRTLAYLSKRGYTPEDVVTWAWILTSPTALKAAMRYETAGRLSVRGGANSPKPIPWFILLFTLRRQTMCAKALEILLLQSQRVLNQNSEYGDRLSRTRSIDHNHHDAQETRIHPRDFSSVTILIVRLLRCARQVWPQALLSIATIITSSLGCSATTDGTGYLDEKRSQKLTYTYNTFLSLLSLPCHVEPYYSVSLQQQAQFQLLREMSRFTPPLSVTRQGYQAITSVQLAHRKTFAERQWAQFKSKSWPPWKEEKLGIDFDRGNEGSKSRAIESINHMRNAGYALTRWERVAMVFAGWDTDKTPTIQTRTFLKRPNAFRMRSDPARYTSDSLFSAQSKTIDMTDLGDKNHEIWAARIRATRTLREAWACFLSHRDQGLSPHKELYFAMAQKLVYHRKNLNPPRGESAALPGDGPEVFPEPLSPKDIIYVRIEPPVLEELLEDMLSRKIKLSGEFLNFLLANAVSFEDGLRWLTHSSLPPKQIRALINQSSLLESNAKEILSGVSDDIFAAFIQFLCKFSVLPEVPEQGQGITMQQAFPILFPRSLDDHHGRHSIENPAQESHIRQPEALSRAVQLLGLRTPTNISAWRHLLYVLSVDRLAFNEHRISLSIQRVIAWYETSEVLSWMRRESISIDAKSLEMACSALIKVILAISQDIEGAERGMKVVLRANNQEFHDESSLSAALLHSIGEGKKELKFLFDQLTTPKKMWPIEPSAFSVEGEALFGVSNILPTMFISPTPSLLHTFVRLFGLAHDKPSLLHLIKWMSVFANEVDSAAEERMGGRRLLRRTVIAARAFLEGHLDSSTYVHRALSPINSEDLDAEGNIGEIHDENQISETANSSTDPLIQEAYDIIQHTDILAPWPTDEEVRLYIG